MAHIPRHRPLTTYLETALLLSLGLALFLVAADWLTWRLRVARGQGTGEVSVTRFVVAPLKGNREEFYADGTDVQPCSRSVLPWGGMSACWWLERQHVRITR